MFRSPIITLLTTTLVGSWMAAVPLQAQPLQPISDSAVTPMAPEVELETESLAAVADDRDSGPVTEGLSATSSPTSERQNEANPAQTVLKEDLTSPSTPSYFISLPEFPDDGPFHWLWQEESKSQSVYEFRAKKSTARQSWLDKWLGKTKPQSPQLTLSDLTSRPRIGAQRRPTEEASAWESTRQRMGRWQQSMKESSLKHWQMLKEGLRSGN